MLEMIMAYRFTQAVRAAVSLGLVDLLASGPTSAPELAKRAGAQPSSRLRPLRALVSIGALLCAAFLWSSTICGADAGPHPPAMTAGMSLTVSGAVTSPIPVADTASSVPATPEPDDMPSEERWRLTHHIVDRGWVTWGGETGGISAAECLGARTRAIRRTVERLQSPDTDITVHDAVVVQTRRADRMVLTVVRFACTREIDWTIAVTNPPTTRGASDDHLGRFSTEAECLSSLELEVDFKARSLQRLGHDVSLVRATPASWTLGMIGMVGTEAGQLKGITTYACVTR
jgi:hypothetical protein